MNSEEYISFNCTSANSIMRDSVLHTKKKKMKKTRKTIEEEKREIIRTRPTIKRGITSKQIRDGYWLEEIKAYCRLHGLIVKGKTTILINRILKYHEAHKIKLSKSEKIISIDSNSKEKDCNKDNMFIKVIDMLGKVHFINVESSDMIYEVQKAIKKKTNIPVCKQMLKRGGRILEVNRTLGDHNIGRGDSIHVVLRTRGAKPVIYFYIKNDHTNVKIAIESNGKIALDSMVTYPTPIINTTTSIIWNLDIINKDTIIVNNKKYHYLFYEFDFGLEDIGYKIPYKEMYCIENKNITKFLEVFLSNYLNSKESNDFITHWIPKIMKMKGNWVMLHKTRNTFYDNLCSLKSSCYFKCIRLYIIFWGACNFISNTRRISHEKLQYRDYSSYEYMVEWGGSCISVPHEHLERYFTSKMIGWKRDRINDEYCNEDIEIKKFKKQHC